MHRLDDESARGLEILNGPNSDSIVESLQTKYSEYLTTERSTGSCAFAAIPVAIDLGDTPRNGEHWLAMPITPLSSPEAVMRIGAVDKWAAAAAGSLRAAVFVLPFRIWQHGNKTSTNAISLTQGRDNAPR
jgi:hypothetical protein